MEENQDDSKPSSLKSKSSSGSMTPSYNPPPLDDDSSSFASTETAVSFLPPGLPGKVLSILGPSVVDFVSKRNIKKRLSSISLQLYQLSRCGSVEAFTEEETEKYRGAYGQIMSFSMSKYHLLILDEVLALRIEILGMLIRSQTPVLSNVWHHQAARKLIEELDQLTELSTDKASLHAMKQELVDKIANELCGTTRIRDSSTAPVMSGIPIVHFLCSDLAYGNGGYLVQKSLRRLASQSWARDEFMKLLKDTSIVVDCLERLLVTFNNPYSTHMAFKIFGCLAPISETVRSLLVTYGITPMILYFNDTIRGHPFYNFASFYLHSKRNFRTTCATLTTATLEGFQNEIMQREICSSLEIVLSDFVQRDDGAYGIIADDEHDDQDVGEDHLAVCRLICALSQEAPQRAQIGETDLPKAFMKFARHPNRIFSSPALLHEIQKVKRRFDVAV